MIFSRSKTNIVTRLTVNDQKIEQKTICKLLGVWISEDLSWSENCKEICKKAFSRLSMITKLQYAGVPTEDLLTINILFIRSVAEYCAVVFHASLTQEETRKIEMIQKTSLRVILETCMLATLLHWKCVASRLQLRGDREDVWILH